MMFHLLVSWMSDNAGYAVALQVTPEQRPMSWLHGLSVRTVYMSPYVDTLTYATACIHDIRLLSVTARMGLAIRYAD